MQDIALIARAAEKAICELKIHTFSAGADKIS